MMVILFKEDNWIWVVVNNILNFESIGGYPDLDFSDIPYLDEAKVLYHYKHNVTGELFPVYYEHNGAFISKDFENHYYRIVNNGLYTRDYTLVNLNILDDGDTI